MAKRTRVAVKILEGKNLLVSDLLTGTSDPVVLLWVSSSEEGEVDFKCDKRVQSTEVRKRTVDPVWDAEFVFPLEIQSVEDVMSGRVNVLVRDHDDADGDVHYVDLGRTSVPLETVLTEGNIMAHTQLVQLPAKWYPLQRCRGIKKSRGAVKIAVGVFFGPDSVLLRNEDTSSDTEKQCAGSAAHFEYYMKRLREDHGINGRGQATSMSPPRRGPNTSRELTARGGTTFLRPKSAPEATTLTSPAHLRQDPFELKPIQPQFPSEEFQEADTVQPDINGWAKKQTQQSGVAKTPPASDQRPRWRDPYGSSDRQQPDDANRTSSPVAYERAKSIEKQEELQDEQPPTEWPVNSTPATASVRPSSKLSRLAATAARGTTGRGRSPGATAGWDERETATVRAHRWQRRLIESMQRLEDRSTEGTAYGELRAMVREASSVQVGQVVTAARGVGASSSLSARKYTLRLLAWLCWDQQTAASRYHVGIISYVLDRARDDETASLRIDLAACVGAVILSALRNGTADACMVQTRRFLRLVGEQRKSVRESVGVCCVASVLPPSPFVPVEVQTDLRSMDDVRLAIGQAAERGRTANAVPKEAVLLPGGRAIIELVDAEAAAYFFDRITATAGDLPSNWRVHPFPEDFCTGVKLAQAAHHAKLTVHSEEILASLLEALGNGRSEGTSGQLFDAITAMANSCATYEGDELEHLDAVFETAAAAGDGGMLRGISATLKKGLPAIVRAVLQVLDCPVRRAHTWKERKAALDVIVSLAALTHLRGAEGPLGEHRAKLVQGSAKGKHDSVASVRGAASEALVALEATEAEEGNGENRRSVLTPASARPLGWGGRGGGTPVDEARQSLRAGERTDSACTRNTTKSDRLRRAVMKAARIESDGAEASQRKIANDRASRKMSGNDRRQGQGKKWKETPQEEVPVDPTLLSSSAENRSKSSKDREEDPSNPSQGSIESHLYADEGCGSEKKRDRHDNPDRRKSTLRVTPEIPDTGDPSSVDVVGSTTPREREERHGSEKRIQIQRAENVKVDTTGDRKDVLMPAPRPAESEVKNGPIKSMVATSDTNPLQPVPREAEKGVQNRVRATAPHDEQKDVITSGDGTGTVVSSSLPAPMHGGVQGETFRLLSHLNNKTESIANTLDDLDQRLLGMERTLVEERPRAADMPIRSAPSPKPKRARSNQTARSDKATSTRRGKTTNAASPKHLIDNDEEKPKKSASVNTKTRSVRNSATRLRRFIAHLVERGDVEGAFRTALSSGTERDVLRLMGSAGGPDLCRHRLGMETRDRFFAFVARTISAGQYTEHALPWVFELVRAGEAKGLPLAVRMQLAGALHGLAANPTDQGIMAARLGPYLSLLSVGRSTMSDSTEGAGVFNGLGLTGSGE